MDHDYFTSQFPNTQRKPERDPGQRNTSLGQAIDDYFEDERARGLLETSIVNMRRYLDPLTLPRYGYNPETPVHGMTRRDIAVYLQRRFDPAIAGRTYSTSGRRNAIRQLKGFFMWAYECGLTDTFILKGLRPPHPDQKRFVPLTDLEIMRVFETILGHSNLRLRNISIFSLMLDSGLRRDEIAKLKKSDLDLDARNVHAFGKKKERLVGFGVRTAELLWLYAGHSRSTRKGNDKDHLFLHRKGTPITPAGVTGLYNGLKRPTGIKRLNAHIIRHTFATRFLQRGGDPFTLRILLGHSSLRMVATYVATAEATDPEVLRDHSIVDETKNLGSILANYTKSTVVRRALTGKEGRRHHKTSTLFMPGRKREK